MALPPAARGCLSVGALALALAVLNQATAGASLPALQRASVLASLLAVGLMLIGSLWSRVQPLAPERVALQGEEGLELAEGLPEPLRLELAWGSQMLLTATPAAVVHLHSHGRTLLRRGLLTAQPFRPGPICQRCIATGRAISLVDLRLYPGRSEFDGLLAGLPAVVVQPIGDRGWLLLGGWSARCFSQSDLLWIEGWARRLAPELAGLSEPGPGGSG